MIHAIIPKKSEVSLNKILKHAIVLDKVNKSTYDCLNNKKLHDLYGIKIHAIIVSIAVISKKKE